MSATLYVTQVVTHVVVPPHPQLLFDSFSLLHQSTAYSYNQTLQPVKASLPCFCTKGWETRKRNSDKSWVFHRIVACSLLDIVKELADTSLRLRHVLALQLVEQHIHLPLHVEDLTCLGLFHLVITNAPPPVIRFAGTMTVSADFRSGR